MHDESHAGAVARVSHLDKSNMHRMIDTHVHLLWWYCDVLSFLIRLP